MCMWDMKYLDETSSMREVKYMSARDKIHVCESNMYARRQMCVFKR